MKIFCLGDSLTAGYGVAPGKCWRVLAAAQTGWELINGGKNGDTSGGMLVRLAGAIAARPDAIFVMGGGNDVVFDGDDAGLRRNMAEIFARIRDAKILPIIGIPCPFLPDMARRRWAPDVDFRAANEILGNYATWLRDESALRGVSAVDFWNLFVPLGDSRMNELYLDGVHLLPEGHRMMAELFCSIIKQFFRDDLA